MRALRQSILSRVVSLGLVTVWLAASVEAAMDQVHRHEAGDVEQSLAIDNEPAPAGDCKHCWHIAGPLMLSGLAQDAALNALLPRQRSVADNVRDRLDSPPTRPPIR